MENSVHQEQSKRTEIFLLFQIGGRTMAYLTRYSASDIREKNVKYAHKQSRVLASYTASNYYTITQRVMHLFLFYCVQSE